MQNVPGNKGMPGIRTETVQESHEYLLDHDHLATKGIQILAGTEDPDHTGKEYSLQAGLVLVETTDGLYTNPDNAYAAPYDDDLTHAVILDQPVDMRDKDGVSVQQQGSGLWHGRVDDDECFWGSSDASRIAAIKAVMPQVLFD
jgi:hypothetical protein